MSRLFQLVINFMLTKIFIKKLIVYVILNFNYPSLYEINLSRRLTVNFSMQILHNLTHKIDYICLCTRNQSQTSEYFDNHSYFINFLKKQHGNILFFSSKFVEKNLIRNIFTNEQIWYGSYASKNLSKMPRIYFANQLNVNLKRCH